jgi:hypothetical protein
MFRPIQLNEKGWKKADALSESFTKLLQEAERTCGGDGREMALVRTHLQEAYMHGMAAIAERKENQPETESP